MKANNLGAISGSRLVLLVFLLIMIPVSEVAAMGDFHWRPDIEQEEIDRYAVLVVAYVKEKKGWEPEEYRVKFLAALADAPLAAFHVIPYKALEEIRRSTRKGLGMHPLEFEVYVQTEEMRAFGDDEEFFRILKEAQKKKSR